MITIFGWYLLIGLYLFLPKNTAYFLGDYHDWLEGSLYGFGDSLNERIIRKYVFRFVGVTGLEHLLPNLVWRHEKTDTDSFYRHILNFEIYLSEFPFDVMFHSFVKILNVRLIESELDVPFVLMNICNWVMVKPYLKEIHKYLSASCIWLVQLISFYFPLLAQFIGDLLHENRVLIESIFVLLIFKKCKIRVIINLIFLLPNEVVFCLLSWEGFTSACVILVLHFWRFFFNNSISQWRNF